MSFGTHTVNADQYGRDAVEALNYRATDQPAGQLSTGAQKLVNKPLWAIAGECLQLAGQPVDMYGDRELIARQAMQQGNPHQRNVFYSEHERSGISAGPANRPGDFPNILSGLANKTIDTIELDDDYSYPEVSAVLPGGLKDFKAAPMVNQGVVEEMDELQDAEQFKELGLEEEMLGMLSLGRYGNSFGWTPVMIANDDMNAFAEGMIGLAEAWQVTQNRLVISQFTTNANLLDGSALFADRANTGQGSNPATNNNDRTAGAAPSDAEWEAMQNLYADIGGVGTGKRVRGTLNTILCPPGSVYHEAVRFFGALNVIGESKQAATTENVGIFRGKVNIVPDSELRTDSSVKWYGLRSPAKIRTATVVRAYFEGFGQRGRRESWFNPENGCFYVSLEGRIAVGVKNWRYVVRNAGTGA